MCLLAYRTCIPRESAINYVHFMYLGTVSVVAKLFCAGFPVKISQLGKHINLIENNTNLTHMRNPSNGTLSKHVRPPQSPDINTNLENTHQSAMQVCMWICCFSLHPPVLLDYLK